MSERPGSMPIAMADRDRQRDLASQPALDVLALKDRALAAAAEGITIADVRMPDEPLIYVNAGFERLTGYTADEVLGRNCRFLQGPKPPADTVAKLREAVRDRRECTVEILNYRKDGTPFWNRLSLTPVHNDEGVVTHYIGIQTDVTARRHAQDAQQEALRALELANRRMQSDLEAAARIQRTLLPSTAPSKAGLSFAWVVEPCDELAGDTLNVLTLSDRHVALYLLDVSGHGVPAALLSVTLSRWLSNESTRSFLYKRPGGDGQAPAIAPPREVLESLCREFPASRPANQFFSMVYAVLDTETRELRMVVAGHPRPIVVSASGVAREVDKGGVAVGLFVDATYEETVLRLAPGDRLFIYSDGLTEARDPAHRELGRERLIALLQEANAKSLEEVVTGTVAAVKQWCGSALLEDDLSVLAVEATK